MKRFREEFIFVEGEYHFAIGGSKAVRFQCENLNPTSSYGLGCNLCVKIITVLANVRLEVVF